jgi:lysophospholipase L1-like esterase
MFRNSAIRTCIAVAVVAAASACSQTPTSPSRTLTPSAGLVALEQLAVPVPPALVANPPNVLGATRFVAFGDSITYGLVSNYDGSILYDVSSASYPVRLQLGLATYHPQQGSLFRVLNRGIPSESVVSVPGFPGGVARIDSVLATDRPQVLLLLEGINDLGGDVPVDMVAAGLQYIADRSVTAGVPVMIATMFQTYPIVKQDGTERSNGAEQVPALNQRIRQIANRQNVYLVDLYAAFGTSHTLVGADGLHPTEQGLEVMASVFMAEIQRRFPVRGSFQ